MIVALPGLFSYLFFHTKFEQNWLKASEEKSFENVNGQTHGRTDGCTDGHRTKSDHNSSY